MVPTARRQTADERRDAVLRAAIREFADAGYAGTPTEAIARRVGVSQPYLFQLFRTKKRIFIDAVQACFDRTASEFEDAAKSNGHRHSTPLQRLRAMGGRYVQMLNDRDALRLQLQAYAACNDPQLRAAVQRSFRDLYERVKRASGADEAALEVWFATGMLLTVAAAIGSTDPADPLSMPALTRPIATERSRARPAPGGDRDGNKTR